MSVKFRAAALIASAAVVVALLLVLGADDEQQARPVATVHAPQLTTPSDRPARQVRIDAPAAEQVRITRGERVVLRVRARPGAELHLHGYDKTAIVPASGVARISLTADADGIFDLEDHRTGTLIAKIAVYPPV